jgi:hypothetical protein
MEALVPSYMSQDIFNTLAIRLAWMRKLNLHDERRQTREIDAALGKYRQFYTRDPFEGELWHTADALDLWLAEAYPNPPEQMAWMNALRIALERYDWNGTRKRRPLFNGLWYTSARSLPANRLGKCLSDIARCHTSLQVGRIPF